MPRAGKPVIGRRQFLCACCALVGARAVPAFSEVGDDPASAPLAKDDLRHHVIFENQTIRVMRVLIPPGKSTNWHEHNEDFGVFFVNGSKLKIEVPNATEASVGAAPTGSLRYADYGGKRFVHRVSNIDTVLNHQLAFEILVPSAGTFGAGDRSAASQYTLEIDNSRIRAWRLALDPGEVANTITQGGPGVRFVLGGERIIETPHAGPATEQVVRSGDYKWLPAGEARAVTNAGSVPLQYVEIELK